MKHCFKVAQPHQKVSEFLSGQLPFLALRVIKSQIRAGEVRINGIKTLHDASLNEGDEVRLFLPKALEPVLPQLETVYEDESVVIVVKPILCETETHLAELVQTEYGFCVPVHRLDRNTSGLVIFARSLKVKDELIQLMKQLKIDKYYLALVVGTPVPHTKKVQVYLQKNADLSIVRVSNTQLPDFLPSELFYETVRTMDGDALLSIRLHQGRTHQIRATMAHLGHPIVGDGKYGSESVNRSKKVKYQQLYAYKLDFRFSKDDTKSLKQLAGKQILWQNCELFKNM